MTQREEFEKFWMKHCEENHLYCNLFRNSLDMYIDTYAEYAFKGWKEAKAQDVPEGWRRVSVESTHKMFSAGYHELENSESIEKFCKSMLAVAPEVSE